MLRMFTPKKRNFLVSILLIFIFIYFYLYCSNFNFRWKKNLRLTTPSTTNTKTNNYLQSALGPKIFNQINSLNCSLILNENKSYINSIKIKRIVQRDLNDLKIDCNSIKNRWKFFQNFGEISDEEKRFPIAFARTVYRDYLMLEQMLSVEYAPHNVYCYSLDRKADKKFKERIRALSRCFSKNVFVSDEEYNVYSSGKNVSRSHLSCLEKLNKRKEDWKYVNHDLPLRTNAELVRIFKAYNGTNDIATKNIVKNTVVKSLDWSLKGLRLYRNENAYPPNIKQLNHTKSLNLIVLSRAAVNFTLKQLNVYPFIDQLEKSRYGMDEVLYSTLNSNLPDFPGGFTLDCLNIRIKLPTVWEGM
uniref:Uncharacterized protein n=1 Tax=Meloidogyne enterolobii TaxID=390850 RepID=A0A6V7VAQ2_MELEN|nr:unnamed protein product [Meloidogyne enterolobii]